MLNLRMAHVEFKNGPCHVADILYNVDKLHVACRFLEMAFVAFSNLRVRIPGLEVIHVTWIRVLCAWEEIQKVSDSVSNF